MLGMTKPMQKVGQTSVSPVENIRYPFGRRTGRAAAAAVAHSSTVYTVIETNQTNAYEREKNRIYQYIQILESQQK